MNLTTANYKPPILEVISNGGFFLMKSIKERDYHLLERLAIDLRNIQSLVNNFYSSPHLVQ